jgi:hypothetical protein
MKTLVVDAALRERLHGLDDQMDIFDENGEIVGMYLPIDSYQALLRNLKIPYTEEQLAQFKKSGGGCSLAEFWKRMGVS